MKTAFFNAPDPAGNTDNIESVFGKRQQLIAELSDLYPTIITPDNIDDEIDNLRDVEVIFATWFMIRLSDEQLAKMPNLKIVLYAAGSVSYFAEPLLKHGITISSAVSANGIPVAEFALAQILLAGAGFWRNSRECQNWEATHPANNYRGHGNYDNRVAILGNGTISNHLQRLLRPFHLEVIVVPSRTAMRTITLEEAFATSVAVVNLFPNRDDNVGVFDGKLFASMMDSAVFINVGRGRQVNEDELIEVMKKRLDLTALLDVQHPEPPLNDSELYTLPNILLSGHIAGSKGTELARMADYMIDEFHRLRRGEPLKHEVDELVGA